jgi:DNA (cytosine-5)-methyltransferase 1
LIYGSVCSGIEAATVAWEPLGWKAAFYSEIEPFPSAVLKHHYPDVPNLGDMTKYKDWSVKRGAIELLVGGTPCQSFSVAGLRKGLADPRGNLALVYIGLLDHLRPRWMVWENVPGVLSSNGGKDFGAFLGGLAELGYGFAYRVLDAEYFGIPQRRRRVFVVGYFGDWRPAASVLFERESLSGDTPPRREKGKGTSESPAHCLRGRSNASHRADTDNYIAHSLTKRYDSSEDGTGRGTPLVFSAINNGRDATKCAVTAQDDKTAALRSNGEHSYQFLMETKNANAIEADSASVLSVLRKQIGKEAFAEWGHTILTALQSPEVLQSWLHGEKLRRAASEYGCWVDDRPLSCEKSFAGEQLREVWEKGPNGCTPQGRGLAKQLAHELGKTLPELSYEGTSETQSTVRRLTPRECCRLQGFPDDYTLIPWRKGMAPDGPRYKALGNSMAVPVMSWIGKRIENL